MWLFDPLYLIMLLPALALGIYAQWRVQSTFAQYSRVNASSGTTAERLARRLLDGAGLGNVKIEQVKGTLTDHYDPRTRTLRLSNPESRSLAALGVAAHEVGHAIQHARAYRPLELRTAIVPMANFGSQLALPLFFLGLFFQMPPLVTAGIVAYSLAVLFTLVTLPVEFNASQRAIALLRDGGFVTSGQELGAVKRVLGAAALTYVAAAATAVLTLLYLLSRRR
ncbi:MAG: zinc metallopeptidase [Candidatus Acetothermia bacterium]|jgi:Zn-dependent membrane protease YugP|nr:zinc metallopeptidase [Candidatus Acetothermia bacterium]MDH7505522.1 zinc metallopeptidase [Candidatus Acetothermia bacterium]